MGIYLREKKLGSGQVSFYLDIYHNKTRWYEFLEIRINKNKPTEQDKEKRRLANEIKIKRENELIVLENGLIDKSKRKANFIIWFEKYIKQNNKASHNIASLNKLKKYLKNKPLPFSAISPEWLKGFTQYLQKEVSNNTTRLYLMDMFSGLEDAVRDEIIMVNPFRKIARKDRVKQQNVFRQAFSLDALQHLADTPCKIHNQIKQAFMFSCFSGLRWSDVNCLRWSEIITKQIDGKQEYFIYFEQEKTEGIEYMPVSDQAVQIIQDRKQEAFEDGEKSEYVFPFVKEYDLKNKLMQKRVNRSLKKWAKSAGIDPKLMHFHAGRHTFATNVLENSEDGDLWTVSKLLGHKNINSTMIYAHVRDKKKSLAVKSLPKLNLTVIHSKKVA